MAATRHFFSTVNEERVVTEVSVTTRVDEPQVNVPSESPIHDEIEPTEPEIPSARTFLPTGLPSRPMATATCRPRTWVQCISEGQIEEHSREDGDSEDSAPLEPLVLEGFPDELGPEWRVLHPFEIPGVRFPTEDTPPTHRRMAENHALVEFIQTAEYLEDVPSWGQRRFYPPQYGDPYYRGRGKGHGRGRGRGRTWLSEESTERDSGGRRGDIGFRGNGRRPDRDWPSTTHAEGISDRRQDSQMPPDPLPSRFSDWSSLDSPHTRTSPHSSLDVRTEQ